MQCTCEFWGDEVGLGEKSEQKHEIGGVYYKQQFTLLLIHLLSCYKAEVA